ncbi:cobalamin B12-binding domain-containing protein [Aeromonas caviae]|uniref:cobalamin B12-binding domain-containing protein n=1 Tax=Aeromonas caviae TaxID=648 RepID=UPI00191CCA17|nr:cobalamin B12-binding domain-containing protein [Aeromonas caviae]MBL0537430.1 cobalamin B12-binding domain-containing protein [Aeromonas caviae]MDH1844612.1 cobalamin B12-binding domain-containing protein [Aeromonas caviae]MDX7645686.1 cobalamin B12-binding domain-containing protein [Aeromonas caviae]
MLAMSVKEKRIMLIYSRISNIGTLPWIPIGLLYIAAVLKKNGFVVKIHDRNKSSEDLFSVIDDFCPDVIGIGAMTVQSDDCYFVVLFT